MARGGARAGAGRPRLSEEARIERERQRRAAKAVEKAAKAARDAYAVEKQVLRASAGMQDVRKREAEIARMRADHEAVALADGLTPLDVLKRVYQDERVDLQVRMRAAALAAPYVHGRRAPSEGAASPDGAPDVIEVVLWRGEGDDDVA